MSSACLPTTIPTPEASPRRASFISNDVSARSADRGEPDIATGTELPSATNDVEHIDTDHVNKVSDVLKLHLKLGHASVQKMENAIKTSPILGFGVGTGVGTGDIVGTAETVGV